MSKSTTVKTVDLNTAHPAGNPALVQIHAHEFYISQVGAGTHGATIHLDSPNGDGEPAEPGPFTSDDGQPFSTIYVVNEAAGEASELHIVTRDGYCRRQEPTYRTVPAEAATSFDPERLAGALAAATTIADRSEASEEVDTAGATTLRVRARVSGTAQLTELSATADADAQAPRAVAVDDPGDRIFVGGDDVGNVIVEFDGADPENPSKSGTISNASLEAVRSLAHDPTNDVLIAGALPGGTPTLVVLDVSTAGAPSVSGSVALGGTDNNVTQLVLDPARQLAFVGGSSMGAGDGELAVVDYSTPATPSKESGLVVDTRGLDVDTGRDLIFVADFASLRVYSTVDPTGLSLIAQLSASTFGANTFDGVRIDPDRDLAFVGDDFGAESTPQEHIYVFDIADRSDPSLLASYVLSGVEGGDFDPNEGMAYLPDLDLLVAVGGDNLLYIDVADPLAVAVRAEYASTTEATGIERPAFHQEPGGTWAVWASAVDDDNLLAIGVTVGADELRIYVTNPGGSRSTTKTPATVTLEDGREGAVDMDLAGEDTIEIEVAGRSGVQTTVDYVDVYRAT